MKKLRELTPEEWEAIYREFEKSLPKEAIQEAKTESFKGYNSTGYAYQFLVNRLNEIIGVEHWRVEQEIQLHQRGELWEAVARVKIQLGDWEDGKFIVCAERECWGGHISKFRGDALKGAFTNAFKKTVALFGIGRKAYEGTLDEDLLLPDGTAPEHKIGVVERKVKEEKEEEVVEEVKEEKGERESLDLEEFEFPSGKYKGKKLIEVWEKEKGGKEYIEWLSLNESSKLGKIAKEFLKRVEKTEKDLSLDEDIPF